MSYITQSYNLNAIPQGIRQRIHIHQSDAGTRQISFKLVDESNGNLTIPTGAKAYIEGRKPSGASFSYEATLDATNQKVSFMVNGQMAAEVGGYPAQVKIMDSSNNLLLAANFEFWCQEDVIYGADMSNTEVPGLIEQILQVSATVELNTERAETAAEEAEGHANSAAQSAIGAGEQAANAAASASAAAASAKEAEDILRTNAMHYGFRWDKTLSKGTRTGYAVGITTNTTNFRHAGSVNENYDNPFDVIYPWSGRKLCNIDMNEYRSLMKTGGDIRDCVIAWEGDPDFSYTHEDGVWSYTPEFYGTSYDLDGYRYFDVTDKPVGGYRHYEPMINGRWHGVVENRTIDGEEKSVFIPKPGMPGKRISMSTLKSYANNWDVTIEDIFTLDASLLLMVVEYATMDLQTAVGSGVSGLYIENEYKIAETSTGDKVKIGRESVANCIPNAIFDIGTAKGGVQVGSFYIKAVEDDGTNLTLTLDREVTVTTDNFWSIHGSINVADEAIGSKSGYIGTNGKANAYYRGEVLWGNMWRYILGAYHEANTNHVWLAKDSKDADNYNAINKSVHIDTGIELAGSNGYIKSLGYLNHSGVLSCPAFCTEIGGTSTNPVGDYHYIAVASNTVLIAGGNAIYGAYDGPFYWRWNSTASTSHWACGARPRLKSPAGV